MAQHPPSTIAGINVGNWGRYPKEYDRAIHGPFDPAKYYGKGQSYTHNTK